MATRRKGVKWGNDKHIVLAVILVIAIIVAISWITFDRGSKADITKPKIAVIPVHGTLTLYGNSGSVLSEGSGGVQDIIKLIEKAENDITVKAIILEINSPGGTVVASEELATAIKNTKKPTVAWMREVAASGGYWVASACDIIVADPATITGSIGVIGSYLQFSELMETYGIEYERLVSGEYKDMGSPYKELTPEERRIMQNKINAINGIFISAISENRNMDRKYVESLATGEIFLGTEAKELNLVDELGSKAKAQSAAENLAGIEDSKLAKFKKEITFWDVINQRTQTGAYWIGRGIGDAWNIFTQEDSKAIKAEI
ncbi:signal peptide peptidase SppA [Candidatus Woesearchaeota archaeon]|nr:signal peptide peptidase SppA [Candidatus Woesearchaeota archaeon]